MARASVDPRQDTELYVFRNDIRANFKVMMLFALTELFHPKRHLGRHRQSLWGRTKNAQSED